MGLAIPRTNARAGSAANAGAGIGHCHDLALKLLIIVIVALEIDKFVILGQAFEAHDIAAAGFEAAAAADTGLAVDGDEIVGLPSAPVARCVRHGLRLSR